MQQQQKILKINGDEQSSSTILRCYGGLKKYKCSLMIWSQKEKWLHDSGSLLGSALHQSSSDIRYRTFPHFCSSLLSNQHSHPTESRPGLTFDPFLNPHTDRLMRSPADGAERLRSITAALIRNAVTCQLLPEISIISHFQTSTRAQTETRMS